MRWLCLVVVFQVETSLAVGLELTAPLLPARSADVRARMSGVVETILVAEGDRVSEADTLALLDDGDLRLSYAAADVAFREARTRLSRAEEMHAKGLISTQQLEALRYDAEAARIRLRRARDDLSRTVVLAPMAGVIAECPVQAEDLTSPRTLLFRVIDSEDLVADLFVPADSLDGVSPGLPVQASVMTSSGVAIQGTVLRLSPLIDPDSGTCRAVALFPGAGRRIRPGALARVTLRRRALSAVTPSASQSVEARR